MMRKTILLLLTGLLFVMPVMAQFSENFSDGDFTANPAWEGGTTDWNSPAEQRERPKRDRLIARVSTLLGVICLWLFARHLVLFLCISLWCQGFCVLQNIVLSVNRCFGLIDWL